MWQFETGDVALHDAGEVFPDALRRHPLDEARVVARIEHDERDVADVTFVSGARVRDIAERHDTLT